MAKQPVIQPVTHRYGRCMSYDDFKELKKTGILTDDGGPMVPVFDAPDSVVACLSSWDKTGRRNYFRRIGVRNPEVVAFFRVNVADLEGRLVGPVRQKNGLLEYKLPTGIHVEPRGYLSA
ncbi:MAG: hypothetical protein Q7R56_03490 [Nanoarchaeota archaeon]|nr:hypothetical protein [Nanoarchaeota archaeon]